MFSLFVAWIDNNKHRKLSKICTCSKERCPSDKVCFLSHNDTRLNKACCLSYKDNHFGFQLFWWSTLLCNSKPEMNAKRHEFLENINTKENNDKWHKLLSKRTYLVCYYLRCHSTWIGLTEWSRSEKVVNMLKSTSPTVDGNLDSSIFGCYARVTPRATSHMRNALALLWATN